MKSNQTRTLAVAAATLLALAALPTLSPAAAVLTLAGFEAYPADSTGTDNGGGYVFNDNSSVSTAGFATATVTEGMASQSLGIDLPLSLGVNNFTLSFGYPASDTSYLGVGLFFTDDGSSFNPTTQSAASDPELSAFSPYDGSGVSTTASGSLVADYVSGPYNRDVYSGASSYQLNGYTVTVTGLSTSGDTGTLQLTVTPEPSSLALGAIGLGLLGLMVWARRRTC